MMNNKLNDTHVFIHSTHTKQHQTCLWLKDLISIYTINRSYLNKTIHFTQYLYLTSPGVSTVIVTGQWMIDYLPFVLWVIQESACEDWILPTPLLCSSLYEFIDPFFLPGSNKCSRRKLPALVGNSAGSELQCRSHTLLHYLLSFFFLEKSSRGVQ